MRAHPMIRAPAMLRVEGPWVKFSGPRSSSRPYMRSHKSSHRDPVRRRDRAKRGEQAGRVAVGTHKFALRTPRGMQRMPSRARLQLPKCAPRCRGPGERHGPPRASFRTSRRRRWRLRASSGLSERGAVHAARRRTPAGPMALHAPTFPVPKNLAPLSPALRYNAEHTVEAESRRHTRVQRVRAAEMRVEMRGVDWAAEGAPNSGARRGRGPQAEALVSRLRRGGHTSVAGGVQAPR